MKSVKEHNKIYILNIDNLLLNKDHWKTEELDMMA